MKKNKEEKIELYEKKNQHFTGGNVLWNKRNIL